MSQTDLNGRIVTVADPPKYLTAKGWKSFQHYRHRNPPWIKLYVRLLVDDEAGRLTPAGFGTLCRAWLALSANDGRLAADRLPHYIRDRSGNSPRLVKDLINKGFLIEHASKALAECYLQTETETET